MSDQTEIYRFECVNCSGRCRIEGHRGTGRDFQFCDYCGHLNALPKTITEYNAIEEQLPYDLLFTEADPYTHDFNGIIGSIQTDDLIPPVASFLTNLRRIKGLLEVPDDVCTLSIIVSDSQTSDATEEQIRRSMEATTRLRRTGRSHVVGIHVLSNVSMPYLWYGIESVLTSQITGAWTAFEVLAGDLWEAAVNCRPDRLATLDAGQPEKPKEEDEASVRLKLLKKYHFDVKHKMGSVLREKLSFNVLDKIRKAYRRTFKDHAILSAINGKNPDPLDTLSFVRNVLVHNAGIADEDFKRRAQHHPDFNSIEEKEKVRITGRVVQKIVPEAINKAFDLIRAIDDWLIQNP